MECTHKELVQKFLDLTWNQTSSKKKLDNLQSISKNNFHYQTTFNPGILSLSEYIKFIDSFRASMSDLMVHTEEIMRENDRVMTHVSFSGSISKPLYGLPATNKIIAFPAVSLWDINNGKIASLNTMIDIRGVERQLSINLPKYPMDVT